ncbi:MAG: hypothetical protein HGB04_10725 [Chlorobiaceae bacterium]|nr:hypothetical protein [Chlorobiaceae bacterium]
MNIVRLLPVAVVVALMPLFSTAMAGVPVSAESVKNIPYHPVIRNSADKVEVRSIRLVKGVYEKGRRFVDQDYEFLRAGQIALGDLNADGKTDAAVVLYHMAGDRRMTQLAIVLDVNGTPRHVASREFGEFTEVMDLKCTSTLVTDRKTGQSVKRGAVSVEVSNETCCGGQGRTVTYIFDGTRLLGQDPFTKP